MCVCVCVCVCAQLQKMLHVPEGFLSYFTAPERFPNLVTALYNLVLMHLSRDTILGRYVRLLVDENEPSRATQVVCKLFSDEVAAKPVIEWGTRSPHNVWFPDEEAWVELTSASSVGSEIRACLRSHQPPQSYDA